MLNLLGVRATSLHDVPASDEDWYLNLLWIDRRKCLLLTHAGTLFPVFAADVRKADTTPIGPYVADLVEVHLRSEGLSTDTLGRLEPDDVQLEKTASRSILGVMNECASTRATGSTRWAGSIAWSRSSSTSSCAVRSTTAPASMSPRSISCPDGPSANHDGGPHVPTAVRLARERQDTRTSPYAGGERCINGDGDGARRARTADLLGAIQALSQLSYSPAEADCSRGAAI